MRLLHLIFFLIGLYNAGIAQQLSVKDVILKMQESVSKVKTVSYIQRSWERFPNGMIYSEDLHKIQVSPLKFYDYNFKPNKGVEVLYDSQKDSKNATVNPNGFPWTNLSLDPKGEIMHKDQHHTLFDAGFQYPSTIIKYAYEKASQIGLEKIFSLQKDTIWESHSCYVVKITAPEYKYIDYTVQNGETLISIAQKNKVNEYQILSHNPSISDYSDVSAGQVIKIPSAYAKTTFIYIDKTLFIPWVQIMYDEKGLFEKYELTNLKLNPVFSSSEFTTEYSEYNF